MRNKIIVIMLGAAISASVLVGCDDKSSVHTNTEKSVEQTATPEPTKEGLDLSAEDDSYSGVSDWSSHELLSLLPDPNTDAISIEQDSSDYVDLTISNVSSTGYKKYADLCKEKGFNVDYSYFDDSFYAKNEEGYTLNLWYNKDDKELEISVDSFGVGDSNTDTESEENNKAEVQSSSSEDKGENKMDDTDTSDTPNIRPEIVEFLDSYEAFAEEYADFMEKYSDEDTEVTPELLDDYNKINDRLLEFNDKADKLDNSDMSDEELDYYSKRVLEINKKMFDY